jgi:hypothetical protein
MVVVMYQKSLQGVHMIPLKTFIVYIHLQFEFD